MEGEEGGLPLGPHRGLGGLATAGVLPCCSEDAKGQARPEGGASQEMLQDSRAGEHSGLRGLDS